MRFSASVRKKILDAHAALGPACTPGSEESSLISAIAQVDPEDHLELSKPKDSERLRAVLGILRREMGT